MRAVVLDAGALIALERRDRRMLALADELLSARNAAHVPAGVIAQVWRGSPRQHAVARLLSTRAVTAHPLSEAVGYQLGVLLATSGASDVTDAHVVALARSSGGVVITSDAGDIRAIDPSVDIKAL